MPDRKVTAVAEAITQPPSSATHPPDHPAAQPNQAAAELSRAAAQLAAAAIQLDGTSARLDSAANSADVTADRLGTAARELGETTSNLGKATGGLEATARRLDTTAFELGAAATKLSATEPRPSPDVNQLGLATTQLSGATDQLNRTTAELSRAAEQLGTVSTQLATAADARASSMIPLTDSERVGQAMNEASNTLGWASFLVGMFSLSVVVVTLVLTFLGASWFRKMKELGQLADDARRMQLDAALLTFHSVPEMHQTQQVPARYEHALENLAEMFHNKELDKIMRLEQRYAPLRFAAALHHLSAGESVKGIEYLEGLDGDLRLTSHEARGVANDARYHLIIAYRSRTQFEEALSKCDDLAAQRGSFMEFSRGATRFANLMHERSQPSAKGLDCLVTEVSKLDLKPWFRCVFRDLRSAAEDSPDVVTRQILMAELLGYFLDELKEWPGTEAEAKTSGERPQTDVPGEERTQSKDGSPAPDSAPGKSWIAFWKELCTRIGSPPDDEERKFKPTPWEELGKYVERALTLTEHMLPMQRDDNIRANWHYCKALVLYYGALAFKSGWTPEKESLPIIRTTAAMKKEFVCSIKLSRLFSDRVADGGSVFSEVRQAPVGRSDFLLELNELERLKDHAYFVD